MLKEVCVENFTDIPREIAAGANRIELNNNLAVGGTTPSYGVIEQSVNYAHQHNVPLVVMIRPRGGNFIYNNEEFEIMLNDLKICASLNVDAVTFGCLTAAHDLDKAQMQKLIVAAQAADMTVVMHMAFDEIPQERQQESLNWLAMHGVKRILTHGGDLIQPIMEAVPHLQEIVSWAKDKIEILAGGGITAANCEVIAGKLGVTQLHGSKIVLMN
ncbi:copper homeostasis protein CutC [Lactobacillus sp. ESL0731]|uniref:copper homeostasis protein CutC n=1 Tax=unclassified Lactobacillus TaxID=2620435 RepID=UPI0023F8CFDC|nr:MULTISPECIES: copper homeostasis protein CutC [unclassified Lactobacillus]WEV50361.1 copper homeostasis protein CutC [Lactobacillus sp. ESL0700]WEV61490.1 copper homeostasis protein CutC [Lactobacillus sp. ESL0731]